MNGKGKLFHIVFLNGPIASGKDTGADGLIGDDECGVRISPGDIIRDAQEDPNHKYRSLLEPYFEVLNSGELVPAEIMVGIVADIIDSERKDGKETLIITGFPRSKEYLEVLDPILTKYEEEEGAKVDFAFLYINNEESWKRTLSRIDEREEQGLPPRPEDTEERFDKRKSVFERDTIPVMQYLMGNGRCVRIWAMGDIEATQASLREGLRWEERHLHREGKIQPTEAGAQLLPQRARR